VARLERELGTTLVDRSAGRLTADGEVVVARAYRVIGELDALVADVGALREAVAGNVRVGILGTTARWLVPMLLADLSLNHPRLHLVVADGTTLGLEPQLAAGRLDLAVLTFPVPGRDLVSEPLFEEDIVLVVPVDDDPLSGAERIDLSDLERFELLLPAPGTPFRGEIDAAVKPAGVRLRPRVELDGVRLLASLTFEGYGPALLPATAVPPHLRPRFRLVDVDGLSPRRVGIAQRSRGLPSAPARAVLDTLRDLMTTPDRLPPGLHPVLGDRRTRAEGSLRVVGMPNG
jgi:LysR family hydrogen peroxide-inducible transcriptional activator